MPNHPGNPIKTLEAQIKPKIWKDKLTPFEIKSLSMSFHLTSPGKLWDSLDIGKFGGVAFISLSLVVKSVVSV